MDVDKALMNARRFAKRIQAARGGNGEVVNEDYAFDLADAFEALDEWLSKGGYLPQPWSEAGKVGNDA